MGKTKQLLPFAGSTIIEQVVNNALESQVDEVIIVLGHQASRIAPLFKDKPVKVAVNRDYHQGMSSSIRCGLNHMAKDSEAVMILLGDQPLIDKEIINRLVAAFARSRQGIVAPVYDGRPGHPVIFAARYRPELLRLEGDLGARNIIGAHPGDILEVAVTSDSIITDIDSERDYRSQRKKHIS